MYKLVIIYYMLLYYKALRMMKDKRVKNSTQQEDKTDTKTVNYRMLGGIELPCTLREGLSLDIRRLSGIINSQFNSQVSEQEERISKSSKLEFK